MRIMGPRAFGAYLFGLLPRTLRDRVFNASIILAWATLPYSVIGALHDLNVVIEIGYAIAALAPDLQLVFRMFASFITTAFEPWRALTQPIRNLLEGVIPFYRQVADLLLLPILLAPAAVRYATTRVGYIASDAALRASEGKLALKKKRAERRAEAEEESRRGVGASVGALVGGLVGIVAGPAGAAAGGAAGAAIGAAVSGGADGSSLDDPETREAAEERSEAERRSQKAVRHFQQSRQLLGASFYAVGFVLMMFLADWTLGGSERCETIRDVGPFCQCVTGGPTGFARPAFAGEANVCVIS